MKKTSLLGLFTHLHSNIHLYLPNTYSFLKTHFYKACISNIHLHSINLVTIKPDFYTY